MTVKLTANFLSNARGLTLLDGGGVTWTINKNTNEITGTAAGGSGVGTVTSVALSDASTTSIYTISGSPVSSSGTLTFTFKTQSANTVLAGPTSGSAAQPTFRALVAADIPQIAYSSLSGLPTIPSAGNPTAKVGTAAVNGSAATFMRSDAAPPIDLTASYTWTGAHTFNNASGVVIGTATGVVLNANGGSNSGQVVAPLQCSLGSSGGDYPYVGYNVTTTTSVGSYKYTTSDFASRIQFASGGIVFQTAASGTSGNAITWSTKLTISQAGLATFTGGVLSSGTAGIGYTTGAGGTVTQGTSRTTGVTLNAPTGAITLFSAAGSATWASFTVTNSAVAAADTVVVSCKSGTNVYLTHVTAVAAGSFVISFATTGGTSTDSPVFNFAVIKGATS